MQSGLESPSTGSVGNLRDCVATMLDAVLSVAAIPDHPLNARALHRLLTRLPLLVASYAGGEVAVLVGGGTPVLQRKIVGSLYGLATGDFDGDGRFDFAVPNDAANYVSVFLTR